MGKRTLSERIAQLDKLAEKETDSTKKMHYMEEALKLIDERLTYYKKGGPVKMKKGGSVNAKKIAKKYFKGTF